MIFASACLPSHFGPHLSLPAPPPFSCLSCQLIPLWRPRGGGGKGFPVPHTSHLGVGLGLGTSSPTVCPARRELCG